MTERQIYVPPGGPPRVNPPNPEIYAKMGADAIVQMLEDFYRELEHSSIRAMFPADMVAASRKSAAFFVGLLGGPPLYHQLYGNPAMRARHMPFLIDEAARQEWLRCFDVVLADAPTRYSFPAEHLPGFRTFLEGFSTWMVNTAA
jgi:hemoglobin